MPSPRQPHPSWIYYALLLLTSGLPLVWWLFQMMADVNALKQKRVFKAGAITAVLATIHAIIVAFWLWEAWVGDVAGFPIDLSAFSLGIGLLIAATAVLAAIDRHVAELEGRRLTVWDRVLVIGLTMLSLLSLPFLQQKLNRLIVSRWPASAAA